jgi:hypothetical protein
LGVWVGQELFDHDLGNWLDVVADRALEVSGKILKNLNSINFDLKGVGVHGDFLVSFKTLDFKG